MRILNEIQKCLRSLLLHRLRSFLSTLGVLFAVAAVIAMLSVGEGAKQESLEQIKQLGADCLIIRQQSLSDELRRNAFEQKSRGLTLDDALAIKRHLPFGCQIAPLKEIEGSNIGAGQTLAPEILAVTREFGELKGLKMDEGRFLCNRDQKEKGRVCVLGSSIAKELGKKGHVGSSIQIGKEDYFIVGVLQSTQWKKGKNQTIVARNLDRALFIPLGRVPSFADGQRSKRENLTEIILQIHQQDNMKLASEVIKTIFRKLHGGAEDYQIVIPQELIAQTFRTQQTFNWILGSIAGISLLVGGIGIMNIMLASVAERTREIGIRRAVGATRFNILFQFLLETTILTLIGAFLGILLGITLSYLITKMAGWKTVVTLWSALLSLAVAIAAGLCSGFYPAYKASLMDPAQALRHE